MKFIEIEKDSFVNVDSIIRIYFHMEVVPPAGEQATIYLRNGERINISDKNKVSELHKVVAKMG